MKDRERCILCLQSEVSLHFEYEKKAVITGYPGDAKDQMMLLLRLKAEAVEQLLRSMIDWA